MKDYTYQESKITNDFVKTIFKVFRQVRYGLNNVTKKDIDPDLARVRWELLSWQLLPGTDLTLLSNLSIYPLIPGYLDDDDDDNLLPVPAGDITNNIIRIIDDPDFSLT